MSDLAVERFCTCLKLQAPSGHVASALVAAVLLSGSCSTAFPLPTVAAVAVSCPEALWIWARESFAVCVPVWCARFCSHPVAAELEVQKCILLVLWCACRHSSQPLVGTASSFVSEETKICYCLAIYWDFLNKDPPHLTVGASAWCFLCLVLS